MKNKLNYCKSQYIKINLGIYQAHIPKFHQLVLGLVKVKKVVSFQRCKIEHLFSDDKIKKYATQHFFVFVYL